MHKKSLKIPLLTSPGPALALAVLHVLSCGGEEDVPTLGTAESPLVSDLSKPLAELDAQAKALVSILPPSPPPVVTGTPYGGLVGGAGASSSGAASYRVELELPRGPGGLTPALALAYSSNAGPSYVGLGWTLESPIRVIHRCSFTYSRDGKRGPANSKSPLCLDGRRLVQVAGAGEVEGAEYRTEIDEYSKIVLHAVQTDRPTSFDVYRRDGLIERYASRTAAASTLSNPGGIVVHWALDKVEDRWGNSININYARTPNPEAGVEPAYDVEIYPVSILYGPNRVDLAYVDLPTPRIGWVSGRRAHRTKRLTSIAINNGRYYALQNPPGTTHEAGFEPKLVKVSECAAPSYCKRSTDFSYGSLTSGLDVPAVNPNVDVVTEAVYLGAKRSGPFVADFNGDGKDDLLYEGFTDVGDVMEYRPKVRWGTATGLSSSIDALPQLPPTDYINGVVTDVDADGDQEILLTNYDRSTSTSGWDVVDWVSGSLTIRQLPGGPRSLSDPTTARFFFDFDGNGLIDLVACDASGPRLHLRSTVTRGFDVAGALPDLACDDLIGAVDTDGDGDTELLVGKDLSGFYVGHAVEWAGTGPFQPGNYAVSIRSVDLPLPPRGQGAYRFADLNQDGLQDAIVGEFAGSFAYAWFSTGDGFTGTQLGGGFRDGESLLPFASPSLMAKSLFLDVNHDGYSDLLLTTDVAGHSIDLAEVHFGGPPTAGHAVFGWQPPTSLTSLFNTSYIRQLSTGDFDGDGSRDIAWNGVTAVRTFRACAGPSLGWFGCFGGIAEASIEIGVSALSRAPQSLNANLLVSVRELATDADTHRFAYTACSSRCESARPYVSYPLAPASQSTRVLGSRWTDGGPGVGQREFRYFYRGGALDLQGEGSLGFGSVETTTFAEDGTTEVIHVRDYGDRLSKTAGIYAGVGRVTREQSIYTLPSAANVTTTKATQWWSTSLRPGVVTVGIKTESETRNGTYGVEAQNDTSYSRPDAYGNVTTITRQTLENLHEIVLEFSDSPSDWLVGRLAAMSVRDTVRSNLRTAARRTTYLYPTGRRSPNLIDQDSNVADARVTVTRQFDAFGNEIERIETPVAGGAPRRAVTIWDASGINPIWRLNPAGQTWLGILHPLTGHPLTEVDLNGRSTIHTLDGFGDHISSALQSGPTTNTVTRVNPMGSSVTASWLFEVEVSKPGRDRVRVRYDRLGRPVENGRLVHGVESVIYTEYDWDGAVSRRSRESVNGPSTNYERFQYDSLGRLIYAENPVLGTSTWRHRGLDGESTDPAGLLYRARLDSQGRVVSHQVGTDTVVSIEYGPWDTERVVKVGATVVLSVDQDALGRVTREVDSVRGERAFLYTPFGELKRSTHLTGEIINYQYDGIGRLTTETVTPVGGGAEVTTRQYDSRGRLLSMSGPDADKSITWAYDAVGRVSSETHRMRSNTYTVGYTYDGLDRIETLTMPTIGAASLSLRYRYDGTLTSDPSAIEDQTGLALWKGLQWDSRGRPTRESFGGVVDSQSRYTDFLERLFTRQASYTNGTSLQSVNYAYDRLGNVRAAHDSRNQRIDEFVYDSQYRLVERRGGASASPPATNNGLVVPGWSSGTPLINSYSYDTLGRIKSSNQLGTWTYGTAGRPYELTRTSLPAIGNYTYDGRGYMLTAPGGLTITPKHFGLPKRVATGADVTQFEYAPDRSRAVRVATIGGASTETHSVGKLVDRVISSAINEVVIYNVYVRGRVAVQRKFTKSGATTTKEDLFLLGDHRGDLQTVATSTLRAPVTYRFSPTGTQEAGPALGPEVQLGVGGHRREPVGGLRDMNGRFLLTSTGTFLSGDPYVSDRTRGAGWNRYLLMSGNFSSGVDPTGFLDESVDGYLVGDPIDVKPRPGFLQSAEYQDALREARFQRAQDEFMGAFQRFGNTLGGLSDEIVKNNTAVDAGLTNLVNGVGDEVLDATDSPAAAAAATTAAEWVTGPARSLANVHRLPSDIAAVPAVVDSAADQFERGVETGNPYEIARGASTIVGVTSQAVLIVAGVGGTLKGVRGSQTGSYTNTHSSGKRYHGKGDIERAKSSGRRIAKEYGDPLVATDWAPASGRREAFKAESRRLDADGGVTSPNNYNLLESPGKKYRIQDGEIVP